MEVLTINVGIVAPWIFTIAASSIDRDFPAPVVLGNAQSYEGVSVYIVGNGKSKRTTRQLGLVYAGNVVANGSDGGYCGSVELLDPEVVTGKMVLCDRGGGITITTKGSVVKEARGAAMVIGNDVGSGDELIADSHILPATLVSYENALAIMQYISSNTNATAHIDFMGTKLRIKPAPIVTAFFSRGPNPITPEILKPNITTLGLNILAAWTGALGPSGLAIHERRVPFNILSGTSMSCPHTAGVTALLKAAHPTWSPAALKSALTTSAITFDNIGELIAESSGSKATTPMVYGAGHVSPDAALAPGLIYDIAPQDYIDFLCSLNRMNAVAAVGTFTVILDLNSTYDCHNSSIRAPGDLNYPSISAL